ncbi:hypothetical protein METY_1023 [Methylopila sp. Yamaguchi]|nr:hypothetical protein METY_1023 [Methylopila sp. Yamaguchi]
MVACALALTPIGHVFGFDMLPPIIVVAMLAVSLAYLAAAELAKIQFRRRDLTFQRGGLNGEAI